MIILETLPMDRDLSKNNATLSSTHCWVIMKRLIYKELGIQCAVAVTVEEHSAYSKGKPCVITLSAHSKAHFFETLRRKKYEQSEQLFPCQRLFSKKKKKRGNWLCGNIYCRCQYDKGFRLSNVEWKQHLRNPKMPWKCASNTHKLHA